MIDKKFGPGIVEGDVAEARVDVEVSDAAVLLKLGAELGFAHLLGNVAHEELTAGHDHSYCSLSGRRSLSTFGLICHLRQFLLLRNT